MSEPLLLSGLNFPADLRRPPSARLPDVAGELRGFLIDVVSIRGGRLAAALGAVELPIALHGAYRTSAFSRVPRPSHRVERLRGSTYADCTQTSSAGLARGESNRAFGRGA